MSIAPQDTAKMIFNNNLTPSNPPNGGGASEYGVQVFGNMDMQRVNQLNGAIQLNPPNGGSLTQMAVPALLVLANNSSQKLFRKTPKTNTKYYKGKKYQGGGIDQSKLNTQSLNEPLYKGGNMLQQAVVPATLILASNMMGKNAMRKMSSFSQKKYTKRTNKRNRNTRVKRRGRR